MKGSQGVLALAVITLGKKMWSGRPRPDGEELKHLYENFHSLSGEGLPFCHSMGLRLGSSMSFCHSGVTRWFSLK